jgi:hypothetical protein
MSDALAAVFEQPDAADPRAGIASGGTLFANALSMAGARAALGTVLTEYAYDRTAALGARLADGIEAVAADAGLSLARTPALSAFWPCPCGHLAALGKGGQAGATARRDRSAAGLFRQPRHSGGNLFRWTMCRNRAHKRGCGSLPHGAS